MPPVRFTSLVGVKERLLEANAVLAPLEEVMHLLRLRAAEPALAGLARLAPAEVLALSLARPNPPPPVDQLAGEA